MAPMLSAIAHIEGCQGAGIASHEEQQCPESLSSSEVLEGILPRRVQSLVFEWAAMYQDELQVNWKLARAGLPLRRISPLE